MVWIWDFQLHELGFRQKSRRYWQCQRRFGLIDEDHLSSFLWCEEQIEKSSATLYELTEFHVTFETPLHNLHFYYHESGENCWFAGGYTSSAEMTRLGLDPSELREEADRIAERLICALDGAWSPRE